VEGSGSVTKRPNAIPIFESKKYTLRNPRTTRNGVSSCPSSSRGYHFGKLLLELNVLN